MITFSNAVHLFKKAAISAGYLNSKFLSEKHIYRPFYLGAKNVPPLWCEHVYKLLQNASGDCSQRGVNVFGPTLADVSDTSIAKLMTRLTF